MAMLADANATGPQQLKVLQDAARAHGVEFAVTGGVCCARAARGRINAAPPSADMNCRLLMSIAI
jgi:hypothetical protein